MYGPVTIASKYIHHAMQAFGAGGHGIHSPFVYAFATQVLNDHKQYAAYAPIERLRKRLLSDRTLIPAEDYGAKGANSRKQSSGSVSYITSHAARSRKWSQLLYRIAQYYRPAHTLELGTSLGLSTAYLAAGHPASSVISVEGNQALASIARQNLSALGNSHARIVTGNFDDALPRILAAMPQVDLAFVDGNHRQQPTENYFIQLLEKKTASSIFIFDDIHWSKGMESAWSNIRQHPSVMLTVDLFHFGMVFFRPEFQVKQHFRIRF